MGFLARAFQPRNEALIPEEVFRHFREMGGGATSAGVSVTPERAEQVGAVFACVQVLAEDVAKLPLILYRRRRDGGRDRATDHPAYRVVHRRPNDIHTAFEFRELLQGHLGLRGNAYAFVNRVRGQVRELLPIRPDRVKVQVAADGGRVTYKVRTGSTWSDAGEYDASQILHLRDRSGGDGAEGRSRITMARESIGLASAAQQHGAAYFRNGAKPGLVAKHPGVLSDQASKNLRDSLEEQTRGENLFRMLLLEEGMSVDVVGLNQRDAQYIESRKFEVEEIARWYRMPLQKIQNLDRATNNNVEQMSLDYYVDTLLPWLVRWEQRLSETLLSEAEREEYFFEFLVDGLLRGDAASRTARQKALFEMGSLNRNEIRAQENLNPVPGGDTYYVATNNFQPLGPDGLPITTEASNVPAA